MFFIFVILVYFGVVDVFYRSVVKEIVMLWCCGSRVLILKCFYKFGSMNMFMLFGMLVVYFVLVV